MAAPLKASMAPDIDLDTGCTVVFEAINPTTGAAVTGVTISNALLRVDYAGGGDGLIQVDNPILLGINT